MKRTFTTAEAILDEVRAQIYKDGRPYARIADDIGVSKSTINNLAMGKTRWPRPTTLFPLIQALGLSVHLVKGRKP